MSEIHVRALEPGDVEQADSVTRAAFEAEFGSVGEATLIGRLRAEEPEAFELIAERDGELVGHIIMSPVTVEAPTGAKERGPVMGLGPMSVRPDLQRRGIGADLVHAALCEAWDRGIGAVVVLGHPGYYPKFGFEPASAADLSLPYDVPYEAFMVLARSGVELPTGIVHYPEAFGSID
jgi:putative acetyltransferase